MNNINSTIRHQNILSRDDLHERTNFFGGKKIFAAISEFSQTRRVCHEKREQIETIIRDLLIARCNVDDGQIRW